MELKIGIKCQINSLFIFKYFLSIIICYNTEVILNDKNLTEKSITEDGQISAKQPSVGNSFNLTFCTEQEVRFNDFKD